MRINLIVVLVVATILVGQAAGAVSTGRNARPDYPGLLPGGGINLVAPHIVGRSVYAYYALYNRWPETWQQVIDARLCQITLKTSAGDVIHPDDGRLDFDEDLYYHYRGSGTPPQLIALYNIDGPVTKTTNLDNSGESLRQSISDMAQRYPQAGWDDYASQDQALALHVLDSMIFRDAVYYRDVHKRFPASLDELLSSGLTPFDQNSLNPCSGQPFVRGAVPYGIEFHRLDDADNPNRAPYLQIHDSQGLPIPDVGWR